MTVVSVNGKRNGNESELCKVKKTEFANKPGKQLIYKIKKK